MIFFILIVTFLFGACTISVSQVHTEGIASDVIDENQAASPDIKAEATVPMKAI